MGVQTRVLRMKEEMMSRIFAGTIVFVSHFSKD